MKHWWIYSEQGSQFHPRVHRPLHVPFSFVGMLFPSEAKWVISANYRISNWECLTILSAKNLKILPLMILTVYDSNCFARGLFQSLLRTPNLILNPFLGRLVQHWRIFLERYGCQFRLILAEKLQSPLTKMTGLAGFGCSLACLLAIFSLWVTGHPWILPWQFKSSKCLLTRQKHFSKQTWSKLFLWRPLYSSSSWSPPAAEYALARECKFW